MNVPRFWRFCTATEIAYWHEQEEAGDVVAARYQPGFRRFQSESPLDRRDDDVHEAVHDHPCESSETVKMNKDARRQRVALLQDLISLHEIHVAAR